MILVAIVLLALVVFIVWWATIWAPADRQKRDIDNRVDDDDSVWPPRPKS